MPSVAEDASEIIKDSLRGSAGSWKVRTVKHVDPPTTAARQASQFADGLGVALREVDVYAVLED